MECSGLGQLDRVRASDGRLAGQVVHGPEGSGARPCVKPQGLGKLVGPQIDPIGGGYRRWGGNGSGCNHSAKSCSPIN